MVGAFFVLLLLLTKKEGNLECYKHLIVFSSLPKNLSIKYNINYKSEFQLLLAAYESVLPFDMHVKFSLTLMGVTQAYYGITRPLGVNLYFRQTALLKFVRKKKGKEIPVGKEKSVISVVQTKVQFCAFLISRRLGTKSHI